MTKRRVTDKTEAMKLLLEGKKLNAFGKDEEFSYSPYSWCPEKGTIIDSEGDPVTLGWTKYFEVIEPKQVRWVNVYHHIVFDYPTRERADYAATTDRIACIKIEYIEGEGL